MRRKKEAVLCFESNDDGLPKVVRDYRARYRAISQVLDDNSKILSAVHRDILKLSEGDSQGREGDYTSENVSVHGVTWSDRGTTAVAEKQGQKERRQGPDGRSEGDKPPLK